MAQKYQAADKTQSYNAIVACIVNSNYFDFFDFDFDLFYFQFLFFVYLISFRIFV